VRWSAGQGRWATIPWIALLDTRETTKPSDGVYAVYLFRGDMTGAYLTLSQGASSLMAGSGPARLRDRAAALRTRCKGLASCGFEVRAGLDLGSNASLANGYEDSTVAFKFYARGSVPSDAALHDDLAHLLDCYQALVPSSRIVRRFDGS
jgi:5-methylcytosine-specific restriction enzyme B